MNETVRQDPTTSEPAAGSIGIGPGRGRHAFWAVLLMVLILDLVTKYVVFALDPAFSMNPPMPQTAQPWQSCPFIWCQLNTGAAWSLGASRPWLITLITLVLIPILFVVYWRGFRPRARLIEHLCFGAILGGALGNAWDRFVAFSGCDPVIGGVRDFIHVDLGFPPFHPWPTFNVADSALTGAVIILMILGFFPNRGASHAAYGKS